MFGQDDKPDSVQWHGMTPLEFITSLAEATEDSEAADGLYMEPIHINGTKLATKTPPFPRLNKSHKSGNGHKNRGANGFVTLRDDTESLAPWDPSYLLINDVYALGAVESMQALAHTLEAMPHYFHVKGSYKRIQDHLAYVSNWIHSTYGDQLTAETAAEKFQLLRNLYEETIHKMEALVDMTARLGPEEAEEEAKMASKPVVKRDFAEYMTQWLKDNWTNPYPDEDGLEMMAHDCGVTTSIISNWLINARTRKWRPAIVKAYELKRPANLLLEDSINIFDGKPVREITAFEASQIPEPSNKRRKYI